MKRNTIVMIPGISVVREQTGNVIPTPHRKKWPLYGVILMASQLTVTQYTTLSVVFVDKKGNPAQVDGVPQWFVDNPNVVAVEPAVDGLSAKVSPVGPIGVAKVSLKADADLGAGVVELVGIYDVEVVAGQAVAVVITATPPQEIVVP